MATEKNTYDSDVEGKYNSPLARRLRELVQDPQTANELKDYLGVTIQAINQYKQGTAFPKTENLIRIAEFFNTSIDWLLGRPGSTRTIDASLTAVYNCTGLSEDAALALRFLHERDLGDDSLTIDFLNLELSHLYRTAIKPGGENLAPVETIFSMLYMYIAGIRPSSIMFHFPPIDGYRLTESSTRYGVTPDQLYSEAIMNVIRSHLEAMKRKIKEGGDNAQH